MEGSEIFHADWCRNLFALLNEGGIWGVPRSGLIFQKRGDKLTLKSEMPHAPGMPLTPFQLRVLQNTDYEVIRKHFAAAGVKVTRG